VVAAPDFDLGAVAASTTRGIPVSPLTGTRDEGVRIAARLGVAPLVGADALERRVKAGRSPRVLHIASHGFFLRDHRGAANGSGPSAAAALDRSDVTGLGLVGNPLLRSGFALAGANSWLGGASLPDAAEDGLLTAEDVSAMDLRQTELAVLSACNTGLGESQFGEGVMGLRRAFVLAGARTLVMSLWKVPDAATAELMDAFYQFLLAGVPRAEALRRAQHQLKKRYPNPFFWGAFICQGDPGPVSRSLLDQAMLLRDALSKRHD
jgi:CHAT domain-containing protein